MKFILVFCVCKIERKCVPLGWYNTSNQHECGGIQAVSLLISCFVPMALDLHRNVSKYLHEKKLVLESFCYKKISKPRNWSWEVLGIGDI